MQLLLIGNLDIESFLFIIFAIVIVVFMAIDLLLVHKSAEKTTTKSALMQSAFWVMLATVFGIIVYIYVGEHQGLEYFTAYTMEYALSVDNIFVIILILRYFRVDETFYHKILFWGILGAFVFRAVFIFIGAFIIHHFHPVLYIFGVFLVYTGFKMLFSKEEDQDINPEENPVLRFVRKYFRLTPHHFGGRFFVRKDAKFYFTPLFLVLILIETTDLIFAVDSIPAAFAISEDSFVVYTSNMFAVMGLRAMFFLLAGILDKFYLLQRGLSIVLVFIGVKMLLEIFAEGFFIRWTGLEIKDYTQIPVGWSLAIVLAVLGGSVVLSLFKPQAPDNEGESEVKSRVMP